LFRFGSSLLFGRPGAEDVSDDEIKQFLAIERHQIKDEV
jgi:hypothetical protein